MRMHAFNARERWILFATIVGSSLVFIDGSVIALALPSIQTAFHADAASVSWLIESYALVLGALMLLGGAIADRFGRKRTFVCGVAIFAFGSLACAFAWSLPAMIVARALQGIGGMLLAPASLALLGAHFQGAARGRAIAYWSSFGALTSTLGPMLGGVLIDALGWRSVFWINLPLAALVILAALRHVEESRDDDARGGLDLAGAALAAGGLGAITFAVIESSRYGWRMPQTSGAAIAGGVLLGTFIFNERRSAHPLLPPALFSSRIFTSVNIATFLLYGALAASFYLLPLVMIQAHGYTATETALATLPVSIGLVFLARVGTRLAERFGVRVVLTIGPTIVAGGFALLAWLEPQSAYIVSFLPGMLAVGIGMGITVAPLTTTVVDAATPGHVGVASGVNTAVSRTAGLLAIAAFTAIIWVTFNFQLNGRLDTIHASAAQRARIDAQRPRIGAARDADPSMQRILRESFENGFRSAAAGCAILAFLAAITDAVGVRAKR